MIAVYIRRPAEDGDDISTEEQLAICRGIAGSDEEVAVFSDDPAGDGAYPALQRMLREVQAGRIGKIVVDRLYRISHSLLDFAALQQMLDEHGVAFLSCLEAVDTSTPQGRAALDTTMAFARFEREAVRRRIREGYYARARQGFYLGGRAPFGYDRVPTTLYGKATHTFAENEIQSPVVREMFSRYAATDISLGGLAAQFTQSGVRTNTGAAWSSVSLGRLLRNPVYVQADAQVYRYLEAKGALMNNDISQYIGEYGCYVYAGRESSTAKFTELTGSHVTLALHRGLVSADIWMRCQHRLDRNRQIRNSGRGGHSWLSGLMKCGYCGMAVVVVNSSRGSRYLNCGGRKQRTCRGRARVIHLAEVERAAEEQLLLRIRHMQMGLFPSALTDGQRETLAAELSGLEAQIRTIVDQVAAGTAAVQKLLNDRVEALERRRAEVAERLSALCVSGEGPDIRKLDTGAWDTLPLDTKKHIAHTLIERVRITDDEIQVRFL